MGTLLRLFQTNNMKLIIIATFVALAAAAPRPQEEDFIAILREESTPIEGANFRHEFEAENGLTNSIVGSADDSGAAVMSGTYSFPLPDGSIATFNWVADALGFRVESNPLLPVAPLPEHPVPAHAQEQIDYANAQQAAGLVWDQLVHAWV